jgi:beta-phosphoglucomutase
MLKAIIFDFNGVILNDEPLHFASMRDAVAALGIELDREIYWSRYLPFDDETCLARICADHDLHLSDFLRQQTLAKKVSGYETMIQSEYPLFPGVPGFIRASAERYPLAIASGARREEIVATLEATGLTGHFRIIVGAQDFTLGKPNPESYLLALERLNHSLNGSHVQILPSECLVIEDSVGGVQGAVAAGMKCLAVANTYPAEKLTAAHRIVGSFEEVTVESLESLMQEAS